MQQTIREFTFETNSSSYHSITIHKAGTYIPPKEIEEGKPTELTGEIVYKTIGGTCSYTYTSRSKLDKANMLLRMIAYYIDTDWVYEQEAYTDIINKYEYRSVERCEAYIDLMLTSPLIIALKDAITNYTKAATTIKFDISRSSPYVGTASDYNYYLYEILKINEGDLEDIDKLTETFSNIIFNDDMLITEECESNE